MESIEPGPEQRKQISSSKNGGKAFKKGMNTKVIMHTGVWKAVNLNFLNEVGSEDV